MPPHVPAWFYGNDRGWNCHVYPFLGVSGCPFWVSPISKTNGPRANYGTPLVSQALHQGNMQDPGSITALSPTGLAGMAVTGVSCRYVDQIEIIENEFRIEKVYYIHGSEQAETLWAEEYGKKGVTWTRLAGESPFF